VLSLGNIERDRSNLAYPHAVGRHAGHVNLNAVARSERGSQCRTSGRFHRADGDSSASSMGDPGIQSATANSHNDPVHVRYLFDDLEPEGSLTRHHLRVVKGMNVQ
jgi:hypothetical protein